ncbi:MAG: CvpA family protein [Pirellulaceae bacterium]|nr:CvpA family protein [Pirellulaceae bacterium]
MQAYDLIMLIVIGMATIFGAIKGFAWQVASLASILISYLVAYRFKGQVAEMIHAAPPWNQFLAMLILYVGTSFVIWVGFRLLSGAIDKVKLKEFDRHIGAAFGLGKGLIYCLLITMFAMSLLGPKQQTAICQSRSGYYIASALDKGVGILPKEIHDVVGPYLERLDEKLKNGQNGMPMTNDPSWSDGLPNFPATDQAAGQGGGNWDLGQLIPNVLQGQSGGAQAGQQSGQLPTTQPSFGNPSNQFQGNQFQGNPNPNLQNNFQPNFPAPNFPQTGNTSDPSSILPPTNFAPNNFAPATGNGFSGGYDGYGSQSAQQPNYTLPR